MQYSVRNVEWLRKVTKEKIPRPMHYLYKWPRPSHWQVMLHQRHMAEHFVYNKRAFNFSHMGTGKTASTIWATDYLMTVGQIKRVLVVCPKSVLHVWADELFALTPHRSAEIASAGSKRGSILSDTLLEYVVVNPDALKDHSETIVRSGFDAVVVDEQTYFKTWSSARTKALRYIQTKVPRLWMMSGSPMPQSPEDMYPPGRFICDTDEGSTFPKTLTGFREKTMICVNRGKFQEWKPRPGAVEMVAKMIGDKAIRYTLDECVDLPDTSYTTLKVDPTPAQKKAYDQLVKEGLSMVDDYGAIKAMNEAVVMTKCLQVAMGAVKFTHIVTNNDGVWEVDCQPKLDALEDILTEADGPVIVFCPFIAPLNYIQQWLDKEKITYTRVDGDTAQTARAQAFGAVQAGEVKVLLANPSAMAHGVTLTTSNQIVWWGLPYSRETYEQANARIVRTGQKRKTHITHLTCLPVESKVLDALQRKGELQGLLMSLIDKNGKS